MDRSHFHKIKTLGVGAFGEVALVNKKDNEKHFYAMKTLCKVSQKKQVTRGHNFVQTGGQEHPTPSLTQPHPQPPSHTLNTNCSIINE